MGKLDGKVAIISGAAQGMGAAHARAFVAEGAKVVLTDLNKTGGQALAEELGPHALFIKHNVTKLDEWNRVVTEAQKTFDQVNILVNNAGIIGVPASTADFTEEDFSAVCAVNERGVFFGMKTAIPAMLKAGGGSIINISSIAGMIGLAQSPNLAYVGTKYAVRGMTKFVATEYGPQNIRVNSVHPGFIMTAMMAEATDDSVLAAAETIPLRRMAQPEEVSKLVLFLASDDSAYINGAEHVIDGGLIAG
jgi:3alpha(or 20beta)-hydroxysteroid dehydrogenase